MAFTVLPHPGCRALRTVPVSSNSSCRYPRACLHARKLRGPCGSRLPAAFCSTRKTVKARLSALQVVSGNVQKVSQEQLEKELADRQVPLIIDFYATWCGPCVLLAKELEQVAAELGDKIKVLKIDTDENPELSTQLQIQGLPTMVFIGMDPKKPALRTEGMYNATVIKEIIANELSVPMPSAAP